MNDTPNSPALTELIEEFKRSDCGWVESRQDGLYIASRGWEREMSEFARLVNSLGVGSMSFHALPMRDRDFALFTNTQNWRRMAVSETPITGAGLDLLPECPNVTEVDIGECPLRGSRLIGLRRFPNVKKVSLGWCEDADLAMEYLAGLKHLEYFTIEPRPGFTGEGLIHFRGHESINWIDMSNTWLKRGLEHLVDCPNLRRLSLTKTEVNNDQLRNLADIKSLKDVWIESSEITDSGFSALAHHPSLEEIGAVGLGHDKHRQLTEKCLNYLESIPGIKSLSFAFRLTQVGIDCLKKMKNLESLWLLWPVISKRELQEISDQLPNCRVEADVFE